MRIGWFGGTFDPPHRGHLAVAQAAGVAFGLDRLLLVPAARQPLKAAPAEAGFADRLAMTALLCEGEPAMEASALDGPRPGDAPNYTIDALRRLREGLSPGDAVFVVVGADALLDLRRWSEPEALLGIAEWVVVTRPGVAVEELRGMERLGLSPDQRARVHLLEGLAHPASATAIRERLRRGATCEEMLVPAVEEYIRARHLYGT